MTTPPLQVTQFGKWNDPAVVGVTSLRSLSHVPLLVSDWHSMFPWSWYGGIVVPRPFRVSNPPDLDLVTATANAALIIADANMTKFNEINSAEALSQYVEEWNDARWINLTTDEIATKLYALLKRLDKTIFPQALPFVSALMAKQPIAGHVFGLMNTVLSACFSSSEIRSGIYDALGTIMPERASNVTNEHDEFRNCWYDVQKRWAPELYSIGVDYKERVDKGLALTVELIAKQSHLTAAMDESQKSQILEAFCFGLQRYVVLNWNWKGPDGLNSDQCARIKSWIAQEGWSTFPESRVTQSFGRVKIMLTRIERGGNKYPSRAPIINYSRPFQSSKARTKQPAVPGPVASQAPSAGGASGSSAARAVKTVPALKVVPTSVKKAVRSTEAAKKTKPKQVWQLKQKQTTTGKKSGARRGKRWSNTKKNTTSKT